MECRSCIFVKHSCYYIAGLNLKILKDDVSCPGASQVIKWVKGCFDAFDRKYVSVKTVHIM